MGMGVVYVGSSFHRNTIAGGLIELEKSLIMQYETQGGNAMRIWKSLVFGLISLALLLSLMLVPSAYSPAYAQALCDAYVSTSGSDSTGDGSMANPWRTVQYGVNNVCAGGTVHVAEGTYQENVVIAEGPVTLLGGYQSGTWVRDTSVYVTTVDGGNAWYTISIIDAAGTVIDGFAITNGSECGISTSLALIGPNGPVISNNNIYGNGNGIGNSWGDVDIEHNSIHHNNGNGISNYGDVRVEQNSIHHNGMGVYSVGDGIVSNNEIWANQYSGVVVGGGMLTVEGNTIRDNLYDGINVGSGADIIDNRITGNGGEGISAGLDAEIMTITGNFISGNHCHGISVAYGEIKNNIVIANELGGINKYASGAIINNTVAGNQGGGISLYDSRYTFVNNVAWGNTPQDVYAEEFLGGPLPVEASYSDIGTGWFTGLGNIQLDPMFVDSANNDYHLNIGSPCIDKGTNVGAPGTDIDGDTRPIDGDGDGVAIVDMGADESPFIPLGVTTNAATNVAISTATLNGRLNGLGLSPSALVSFQLGLTTSYGRENRRQTMTGAGAFSFNATGLTPGTTYHYRARAAVGANIVYGADMTFTTSPAASLSVTTNPATSVARTAATLNGYLNSMDGLRSVVVSFQLRRSTGSYREVGRQTLTAPGPFSFNIIGLSPGATYYFRAKAGTIGTTVYGGDLSFITCNPVITVSPTSGPPGSMVYVTGSGFPPNTLVSISLQPTGSLLATAITDSSGGFAVAFVVPAVPRGTYRIRVDAAGGVYAIATFRVP
jgi:hypothetical protein